MTPLALEGLLTGIVLAWAICELLWLPDPEARGEIVARIQKVWKQ